jgi:hypothetical protein
MLIVKHQPCTTPEICLGKQYVYTATADFTHKAHYTLEQVKEKGSKQPQMNTSLLPRL